MDRVERTLTYFTQDYNCAQSVLAAYGPQLGLDRETATRVSAPFGGGIGGTGETCGAVTGALMVIGLWHSQHRSATGPDRDVYKVAQRFLERFRERNGSTACKALLGVDLSAPGGREQASERALFTSLCPRFVRDAAAILEGLLEE
jgi:C_GCAxxG_C_C family probable redox protein